MEKFYKRKSQVESSQISKQGHIEVDLDNLPADPGLRKPIYEYHPNVRDQVRRAYLQKGPCQPRQHDFPKTNINNIARRFVETWYDQHPAWLEYSISKDACYCLFCYLFKSKSGEQGGGDSFVRDGFSNWRKKERLDIHVGGPNSAHNEARIKCGNLMNQKQSIVSVLSKQSTKSQSDYRIRLNAAIECTRFLLHQGLPFRGHDETEGSSNQGNYLELLGFLARNNEVVRNVVLNEAPGRHKLTSPDIQKEITQAAAEETTNVIIKDLGDSLFSILIDESRDVSIKEQMAVVLRYVDKNGHIIERFLGIQHVAGTTAISLKAAIDALFSTHGLSMSRLRGQGYDGASNMQGEFNGLKALILRENPHAFYVHCFAHQLQLALVALTKSHNEVADVFNFVSSILNIVGASCKRRDTLREKQHVKLVEALDKGEITSGRGLNQETTLRRYGDTRWGSHYITLLRLIAMFSSVLDSLEIIREDGSRSEQRTEAIVLFEVMQSYDFVFILHFMKNILGITNELSQALQRKDQDIQNAMGLVNVAKQRFESMRVNGWDSLMQEVSSFCSKHDIVVLNMNDPFKARGRPRRKTQEITNLHHFRFELFNVIIDRQLRELEDRFTEATTELLLCVACLNPSDSFSAYNKEKLICLAQFYPEDFSVVDLAVLDNQLDTYIIDVQSSDEFSALKGIASLAEKMVQTKKNLVFPLVYMLVSLALILPVATASVERAFSAMHIVKSRLRNRMGDKWMNDSLVVYIEKDIFDGIDNEVIMGQFQNMRTRKEQL